MGDVYFEIPRGPPSRFGYATYWLLGGVIVIWWCVLPRLKSIFQFTSQSCRMSMSSWSCRESARLLMAKYAAVSSVQMSYLTFDLFRQVIYVYQEEDWSEDWSLRDTWCYRYFLRAGLGGSIGYVSDWWSGGCGFDHRRVGNILSWRFDHEIFSTVILFLPLIQERRLSVSGERMCTILVNRLED